jgi:hypothetical protein
MHLRPYGRRCRYIVKFLVGLIAAFISETDTERGNGDKYGDIGYDCNSVIIFSRHVFVLPLLATINHIYT